MWEVICKAITFLIILLTLIIKDLLISPYILLNTNPLILWTFSNRSVSF